MTSVKHLLENYRFLDIKQLSIETLYEEDKFYQDDTNLIGKGKNSRIKFIRNKHSDQMIALKILYLDTSIVNKEIMENIESQVKIHRKLAHPNIVEFHNYFKDSKYFYVAMELADKGSIYQYKNNERNFCFSEEEAFPIFFQLSLAVDYLHQMKIVHANICAENVLLDAQENVKLTGFSMASEKTQLPLYLNAKFSNKSFDYVSPEVIKTHPYNETLDIWCLGLFLYEILFGRLPFKGKTLHDSYSNILQNNPGFPTPISPDCQDLILGLLQKEPQNRLTMGQIFSHKWFLRNISEYDTSFLIDKRFEMNKASLTHLLEKIYDVDDISFLFLFGDAKYDGLRNMNLETPAKGTGNYLGIQESSQIRTGFTNRSTGLKTNKKTIFKEKGLSSRGVTPERDHIPENMRKSQYKLRQSFPKVISCNVENVKSIVAEGHESKQIESHVNSQKASVNEVPERISISQHPASEVNSCRNLNFENEKNSEISGKSKRSELVHLKPESELNIHVGGDSDFDPFDVSEGNLNQNAKYMGTHSILYRVPCKNINTSETYDNMENFIEKDEKFEEISFNPDQNHLLEKNQSPEKDQSAEKNCTSPEKYLSPEKIRNLGTESASEKKREKKIFEKMPPRLDEADVCRIW